MRMTGFSFKELMTHANDDLTIKYFERLAKTSGGQGAGVSDKPGDNKKDKKAGDSGYGEPVTEGA
jgi:hypothetical protein